MSKVNEGSHPGIYSQWGESHPVVHVPRLANSSCKLLTLKCENFVNKTVQSGIHTGFFTRWGEGGILFESQKQFSHMKMVTSQL